MKKKITQVTLFVLIVLLALWAVDTSLQGSAWWCRCADQYEAREACEAFCGYGNHGDCLFVSVYWDSCVCMGGFNDCSCRWYMECEDRARGYVYTTWGTCMDCW